MAKKQTEAQEPKKSSVGAFAGVILATAVITAGGTALLMNSDNDEQLNNQTVAQAEDAQAETTQPEEQEQVESQQTNTIVDVAVANEFDTLVAAVQAADLVDTLSSEGPFTVFAPTNEAFEALPEGTLEELLKPENKQQLADILTFHVVAGELDAEAVIASSGKNVTTVLGEQWHVLVEGSDVFIVNPSTGEKLAKVLQTDVRADNGIVHVIDSVLLPSN